jgi:hypothetical protein
VHGGNCLNAADGFSQVRRPGRAFIVTKLDLEQRFDGL